MRTQLTTFVFLALFILSEVHARTLSAPVIVNDTNAPDLLHKRFGKNVIQSYQNNYNRIKSCGKNGAPDNSQCYYFSLEPTSNSEGEKTYKARVELNIPLQTAQSKTPQLGQTWHLQWYFYVDPKNVVTNGFFNIHQIFGEGFGPLLCHGFQDGKYYVSHSEGAAKPEYLGSTDMKNMMGKWVLVNENVHFAQKGWYQVSFTDAQTGQTIYSVPRTERNFWGKATSIHTKYGIYRRKADKNHGSWPTSHVAFSEFKFNRVN